MTTDKEVLDSIHINIHALRLMKGYKPSDFEIRINRMIAERYASNCKECRERVTGHSSLSQESNPDTFMGKLGKWANGAYKNAQEME